MSTTATDLLGPRVNLTQIDTTAPRPWTRGAAGMLRPGIRCLWFAPRGVGKSLAALILAVQVIEDGGHVLYLDLENGAERQAERLRCILADRDSRLEPAVSHQLDYRSGLRLRPLPDGGALEEWASCFDGADVVILDSLPRALGHLGLDENSPKDFGSFMVSHVDPISHAGSAVLLLDNVGHGEQLRPRGASAKEDQCELAYKLTGDRVSREQHGTLHLECRRSRDGDEEQVLRVGAGGGRYGRLEATNDVASRRQTAIDEILCQIQDALGNGPLTKTETAKAIGRTPSDGTVRRALENLVSSGLVSYRESDRTYALANWQ